MFNFETPGANVCFANTRTLCKYALWYVCCIIILLHFYHLDRFICAHFTTHAHLLVLRVTHLPCNKCYMNSSVTKPIYKTLRSYIKVLLYTHKTAYGGGEVQLHFFFTSTLDGQEHEASRHGRFIPGEINSNTDQTGGWLGHRTDLDILKRSASHPSHFALRKRTPLLSRSMWLCGPWSWCGSADTRETPCPCWEPNPDSWFIRTTA